MVNRILLVSIHKYTKQSYLAECKPKIELGKTAGNGPGMIAFLTAQPQAFLKGAATAVVVT